MEKEEIVEGLRVALNKGEPLKRAMMSFYNAGFNKRDIEESAKALATGIHQQQKADLGIQQTTPAGPGQQPQPIIAQIQPQIQATMPVLIPQPPPLQPAPQFRQLPKAFFRSAQMVSDYTQKPRPASVVITILLTFLLLSLLGILAAVFLFKDELTQFFGGGFWWSFLY